ncbi:hypothetical protein DENSPDRAFT_592144 [Dentipellis sp. KUC8613]|nr:hypothetical protein DENSPDRAFT_592144 [Dentipellis sp. KUC8613]
MMARIRSVVVVALVLALRLHLFFTYIASALVTAFPPAFAAPAHPRSLPSTPHHAPVIHCSPFVVVSTTHTVSLSASSSYLSFESLFHSDCIGSSKFRSRASSLPSLCRATRSRAGPCLRVSPAACPRRPSNTIRARKVHSNNVLGVIMVLYLSV